MRFKVGDRVLIKSLDWYNENKDEDGDISCGEFIFVLLMSKFCGKILTIDVDFEDGTYLMKEDTDGFVFTNEMIEGLVKEECDYVQVDNIPDVIQAKTSSACSHNGFYGYSDSEGNETSKWYLPEGYQFVDENGNIINATKIVLEKKNEYPKTYCECKDILGLWDIDDTELGYYKTDLIDKLQMLLICRDAYWKIAGEEMGLGKPWEPDYSGTFEHGTPIKYVIYNIGTHIVKERKSSPNHILSFPTEEMRDAFYEAFKEEIEKCKEFL